MAAGLAVLECYGILSHNPGYPALRGGVGFHVAFYAVLWLPPLIYALLFPLFRMTDRWAGEFFKLRCQRLALAFGVIFLLLDLSAVLDMRWCLAHFFFEDGERLGLFLVYRGENLEGIAWSAFPLVVLFVYLWPPIDGDSAGSVLVFMLIGAIQYAFLGLLVGLAIDKTEFLIVKLGHRKSALPKSQDKDQEMAQ
ncbi:MAG: hypothetical protein NTW86_28210 [Candidatus Sumerlaeota bacterium]|nr:hypothetical protein [Candidatus Sumerlaeota bacterium]